MTERKPKPIALFDLDGTLADFNAAMKKEMDALRIPYEPEWQPLPQESEPPHWRARRRLVKAKPGFWRNLPPLAQGQRLYDIIVREADFDPMVLSKGPRGQSAAWAEKVEWVDRHLGGETPITLTTDKQLVYGRILVDDWPDYILPWLEARPRGVVIMPSYDYNKHIQHERVVHATDNEACYSTIKDLVLRLRREIEP